MHIPHSSTLQRDFTVSMTSMIDVVFLLLIFFVCTASFQITEAILPSPLALDGATSTSLPPELVEPELERILITLTQNNGQTTLTINDQPCPSLARLSELLTALANIDTTLPIILDIDDATPLGTAIDIYDRCRLANFSKVQFAAEVPK